MSNCVSTKQREWLLKKKRCYYDAGFFKLKVTNFVAIDGNRGAQQEFSVSIMVF